MASLCTSQELHDNLTTKQCLCKYREQDILDQVNLEMAQGFQATSLGSEVNMSAQVSTQKRDEILLKVSFIANIMEVGQYCKKVCEVQEALGKDEKLQDMWALVSFPDQLVAYSAMKCTRTLLLCLTQTGRHDVRNFLCHALHCILENKGHTNTPSDVYRHIFTFDLFSELLQLRADTQGSSNGYASPCMTSVNTDSSLDSQSSQTESIAETCCCTIQEGILNLCEMLGTFVSASALRQVADGPSENFLTWLLSLEPSSMQTVCFSYARLLHVLTKYVCHKADDDQMFSYVSSLLQPLCGILTSGGCRDAAFVKMLLSTAITCVSTCVKKLVPGHHMLSHAHISSTPATLNTVIVDVISAILEPACLHSLPFFDSHIGFGGTQFGEDARIPGDLAEYCKGDQTLLRRLATFVILCVEYASHLVPDYCQDSIQHLLQLTAFIRAKSKAASKACGDSEDNDNWIFLLFGDQDDALIATMHSLLKIHCHQMKVIQAKATQVCDAQHHPRNHGHGRQNTEYTVVGCGDDKSMLHPHAIFLSFLGHITHDHSILLDLCISTETEFLEYFVRFLRYVSSDWQGFKAFHSRRRKISEEPCNDPASYDLDSKKKKEEEEVEEDDKDVDEEDEEGNKEETMEEEGRVHTLGGHMSLEDRYSTDFCSSSKTLGKGRGDFCDKKLTVPKAAREVNSPGSDSDSSAEEHDLYGGFAKRQKVDGHVGDPLQKTQWMCSQKETLKEQEVSEKSHEDSIVHHTTSPNFQNIEQDSSKRKFDCSSSYSNQDGQSANSSLYTLDDTMTVLIRLRLAVERLDSKGLFPFSAKPLVRLLVKVEDLYESGSD
ncbi:uncharacterized protein [Diadema antillarum]|uniref:uncharacterized protein n=1 Tax=Diadema antillarum TaxID=105358 RepID=UPI003A892C6A